MAEKKQSIYHLTKEEKLELENSLLKEQNLSFQIQGLQAERQRLIDQFCKRVGQNAADIVNWNLQIGTVEFKKQKE